MEENYRVKTHLTNQVDRLVGNVEYKGYFHGQPKFSFLSASRKMAPGIWSGFIRMNVIWISWK